MQLKNNDTRYGFIAKSFHWVMFVLILFLLLVEPIGDIFPRRSPERFFIIWLHQSTGITVFMLVVLRLIWRMFNKPPPYPASMPSWQKMASNVVHWTLYAAIIIQPIAGVIMVRARGRDANFFSFQIPAFPQPNQELAEFMWFLHHDVVGKVLLVFVIGHILAALYHHFIVKDNILKRMGWGV